MKYKVGDKVRVIPDLEEGKRYNSHGNNVFIIRCMLKYAVRETEIIGTDINGMYCLRCDDGSCWWPETTLLPTQYTNADKIRQMTDKELERFLVDFSICNLCTSEGLNKNFPHVTCEKTHKKEFIHSWLNRSSESERKE